MTNLEKMNELVGAEATAEQIKHWAYNNRISVVTLHFEDEFESMEKSVDAFIESDLFGDNEFKNWDGFLSAEYVE